MCAFLYFFASFYLRCERPCVLLARVGVGCIFFPKFLLLFLLFAPALQACHFAAHLLARYLRKGLAGRGLLGKGLAGCGQSSDSYLCFHFFLHLPASRWLRWTKLLL